MTDLKLAAQKALEAMAFALYEMRHTVAPRDAFTDAVDGLDAQITALRATIKEQEEQEPVAAIVELRRPGERVTFATLLPWTPLYGDKVLSETPLYATPPLLQKEEGVRVLNALDVLNRMGLGPQDTAPAETFLRILGERGMWVIDAAIATRQGEKP